MHIVDNITKVSLAIHFKVTDLNQIITTIATSSFHMFIFIFGRLFLNKIT